MMNTEDIRWRQRFNQLEDRNLTTHTYNEKTAQLVEQKIRATYFPCLRKLYQDFTAKVSE